MFHILNRDILIKIFRSDHNEHFKKTRTHSVNDYDCISCGLSIFCPYRVHMYKTKIEEIQSGKLQIDDMPYAASDLHPYSAYLMAVPYIIIEVVLGSLYYVRTRDS